MRLIDADAVVKYIMRTAMEEPWHRYWADNDVENMIEIQPTIDAVPVVHGKWEWNTNNGFYYCSNCKTVSPREDQDGEYCDCPNYCPGCGAKMEV